MVAKVLTCKVECDADVVAKTIGGIERWKNRIGGLMGWGK
jgi:hypothetical protein